MQSICVDWRTERNRREHWDGFLTSLERPSMSIYVHPQGLCESPNVGRGTRVWAFAHILPRAVVGAECNICDHVFVENDVVIGDRVTIKCGVQLWDGIRLESDVFVGPNATFTNDPTPRNKEYPPEFVKTIVRRGASIGANATILPGVTIGERALVAAGSVVTHDVPPVLWCEAAPHVPSRSWMRMCSKRMLVTWPIAHVSSFPALNCVGRVLAGPEPRSESKSAAIFLLLRVAFRRLPALRRERFSDIMLGFVAANFFC
jgi:acetyltransferase-like isoleucine patch superfamily enzyme